VSQKSASSMPQESTANGGSATALSTFTDELELVRRRRGGSTVPPSPEEVVGLALSGGGIRSATTSLGVLQGFANAKLLNQLDYLSTVSGGGYIGCFVGSIFARQPTGGPIPATSPAQTLLREDFSRRSDEYQEDAEPVGWSLQWLRKSGRYLAPTGAGDYVYALAMQLRNLVAVHYVLGLSLVVLSLIAIAVDGGVVLATEDLVRCYLALEVPDKILAGGGLLELALVVFVLWLAPSALAYFAAEMRKSAPLARWWLTTTFAFFVVSIVFFALGAAFVPSRHLPDRNLSEQTAVALLVLSGLMLLALIYLLLAGAVVYRRIRLQSATSGAPASAPPTTVPFFLLAIRVQLTQVSAVGLSCFLALLIAAGTLWLVDCLISYRSGGSSLHPAAWLGAIPLALRYLVNALPKKKKDNEDPSKYLDLAVTAIGILAFAVLVVAWTTVSKLAVEQWDGSCAALAIALVLLAWLAFGTGRSFQFLNLTTIQRMYASRISRAYLGATNPARAAAGDNIWQSISDSHPKDDFTRRDYYADHIWNYGAPVHLINVTINQTVSPTDPLVQRDRKGCPLVVTPVALGVDGRWYKWAPLTSTQKKLEDLSIGSWIGISGAAFTTGLGRATTLGKSLLLTIANVRLGHWWRAWPEEPTKVKGGLLSLPGRALTWLLTTQKYLASEMFARYSGSQLNYWYLSDGGHFENTAAYELLRRRIGLIVVSDNGADPDYENQDLANLIRLARIDFAYEFLQLRRSDFEPLDGIDRFVNGIADPGEVKRGDGKDGRCFSVFYAFRSHEPSEFERGSAIIVIKPRLIEGAPADVLEYAKESETFPQETTADQFFKEGQWESYRRLGVALCAGLAPPRLDNEAAPAGFFPSLRERIIRAAKANRPGKSGTEKVA
jgi:hypothetical protein